jgi:hypothetical protein
MTMAVSSAAGASPLLSEARAIAQYIEAGASGPGRRARQTTVASYRQRFTNLAGWGGASLQEKLGAPINTRTLVAFLVTAMCYPVEVDYVRRSGSEWGRHAARVHPGFAQDFHLAATGIGFSDQEARRQWLALAKITATTSLVPDLVAGVVFGVAADALTADSAGPTGKIPIFLVHSITRSRRDPD